MDEVIMVLGTELLTIAIGYLLGSLPFAYIVARLVKGVDIRCIGNGNVGAANVMRQVGIIAGLTVLFLDMAKGLLAVAIARWLGNPEIFIFIAGFAVVAGHIWPVFLGFKGGGGAATTLGVLLALAPREFAISFAIIVMVVFLTRNFGFAVGFGLVALPLIIWGFGGKSSLVIYPIALALFCAFKNIRSVISFVHGLFTRSNKGDLIIDKRFTLWQRRGKR